MKKRFGKILCLTIGFMQLFSVATFAETNGYGVGQGRTDSVNVNDYSTSSWDRYNNNYEFETGPEYKEILGQPTQTDIVPRNQATENVRRNKDVSFTPPAYGVFSGDLDTERSNPYISVQPDNYARNNTNANSLKTYDTLSYGSNGVASDTGVLTPTSISADGGLSLTKSAMEYPNTSGITSIPNSSGTTTGTYASNVTIGSASRQENEVITEVSKNSDGSIGTLRIPKLRNLNVKIYEGETLDNMRKGVGQFAFTTQWDGNVGLAGHNSGSAGYFQGIWDLDYGTIIEYQTKLGTRKYEITMKEKISDDNFDTLGWTSDNRLTIITCVAGVSGQRWSITAEEVK